MNTSWTFSAVSKDFLGPSKCVKKSRVHAKHRATLRVVSSQTLHSYRCTLRLRKLILHIDNNVCTQCYDFFAANFNMFPYILFLLVTVYLIDNRRRYHLSILTVLFSPYDPNEITINIPCLYPACCLNTCPSRCPRQMTPAHAQCPESVACNQSIMNYLCCDCIQ